MRFRTLIYIPLVLLLVGCAIPRDMVGNRRIQKDYYDYYGLDYDTEHARLKDVPPGPDPEDDRIDRLLNEKPKHNSAGWKYEPRR